MKITSNIGDMAGEAVAAGQVWEVEVTTPHENLAMLIQVIDVVQKKSLHIFYTNLHSDNPRVERIKIGEPAVPGWVFNFVKRLAVPMTTKEHPEVINVTIVTEE